MILTAKIQVHPTRKVEDTLWSVSKLSTQLWNACIEQRRDQKARGKINFYTQKKELPFLKKELPSKIFGISNSRRSSWLDKVNSKSLGSISSETAR